MNFSDTLDAITTKFKTDIQDAESVAVIYDNDPTNPPADGNYIEFSVLQGESRQRSIGKGARSWRSVGIMSAIIKVEVGKGLKPGVLLADAITAAFRGRREGGVEYKTPSVTNAVRNGKFWQVVVTCEYEVFDFE